MRANEIRVGDVLKMAVGPTLVLEIRQKRGGIECRVPRTKVRADSPFLWFYPQQVVTVLRRNPERVARWKTERAVETARLLALRGREETGSSPRNDVGGQDALSSPDAIGRLGPDAPGVERIE